MIIRPCTPSDESIWIQLNREFMAFDIADGSFWNHTDQVGDEKFAATFREALKNPEYVALFLMEDGGEPVGFLTLQFTFSIWSHGMMMILDDIYIREAYRGSGFGKQAFEFIEGLARKRGVRRLEFKSEAYNDSARGFYQSIGFKPAEMYFYIKYLQQ